MENKTQQFLDKCKEAGYEKVTIFIRDKRIPLTKKIKDGNWWGLSRENEDGEMIEYYPHKVVCGHPQNLGKYQGFQGSGWPKMWSIVKELGLTAGLRFGGFGLGDAHDINPAFIEMLTPGYYELSKEEK